MSITSLYLELRGGRRALENALEEGDCSKIMPLRRKLAESLYEFKKALPSACIGVDVKVVEVSAYVIIDTNISLVKASRFLSKRIVVLD